MEKYYEYLRRSQPYKDDDGKLIEPFSIEAQRQMNRSVVKDDQIISSFIEIETATGTDVSVIPK